MANNEESTTELDEIRTQMEKLSPEQRKTVILSTLPVMIFRVNELITDDKEFRKKTLELIKDYK